MQVTGGATDVTTYFVMRLASNGTAATGLTVTNFDLQYVRSGVAPVAKVDATALAATDSAHAANKAIEIDATDQPGLYRVDWPDAAFAAGVPEVILTVKCATCFTEHLAVQIDPEVSVTEWNGVKLGTTNPLPNAAADAAGGLPISDAGGLDIDTLNANVSAMLAFWNVFILTSGTIGATGNDTTHLHLTGQSYGNDELNDYLIVVYDNSVAEYHATWITDWVLATELATVVTLPFTPEDSVDPYWIFGIKKDPGVALADGAITAAKIAADAITAAKIATGAITSDEIAASGANKIADHIIRRGFENACDSSDGDAKSFRSLLGAIAKLVNKISVSGTTLTITEDDDSTALGTQSLSTDPDAEPIIGADTA
jgi:hypothetical protein